MALRLEEVEPGVGQECVFRDSSQNPSGGKSLRMTGVLEDGRSANRSEKREFNGAHHVALRGQQPGRRLLRSRAGLARNLRPLRAGHRPAALMVTAALAGIEYLVGGNGLDLRSFWRGVMVMTRGRCVCLGRGQWLAGTVRAGGLHGHRHRRCHRGKRPRKQDQQRETGDEPAHIRQLLFSTSPHFASRDACVS
jgi:hypothetical protein